MISLIVISLMMTKTSQMKKINLIVSSQGHWEMFHMMIKHYFEVYGKKDYSSLLSLSMSLSQKPTDLTLLNNTSDAMKRLNFQKKILITKNNFMRSTRSS